MRLTPQQKQLLEILSDGRQHCAFEFREKMFIVDYRKRLSELKRKGFNLLTDFCHGECGRRHNTAPKIWRWEPVSLEEYAIKELALV